jgi:hypothetical protein
LNGIHPPGGDNGAIIPGSLVSYGKIAALPFRLLWNRKERDGIMGIYSVHISYFSCLKCTGLLIPWGRSKMMLEETFPVVLTLIMPCEVFQKLQIVPYEVALKKVPILDGMPCPRGITPKGAGILI